MMLDFTLGLLFSGVMVFGCGLGFRHWQYWALLALFIANGVLN